MKKVLLSILTVACLLPSCKKPEDKLRSANPNLSSVSSGSETLIEVSDADGMDNGEVTYTVVGEQYDFPFKTENIRKAWNNLSSNDIEQLEPTHKYVKFSPQTIEQVAAIQETGLPVFDFPLDHHIIEYGNILDGSAGETMPELYTFAPIDFEWPDAIPSEVLFTVYFTEMESVVTEEAFRLAGLQDEYPYHRSDEPNTHFDIVPTGLDVIKNVRTGWTTEEPPVQPTGTANYQGDPLTFNTPIPDDVQNACNCERNADEREPSGCVLVEETRFENFSSGVRNVMVEFAGPFGQYMNMWTNENGCFRTDRRMHFRVQNPYPPFSIRRLPVAMQVVFKSDELLIRSLIPKVRPDQPINALVHNAGNVAGNGLNQITVRYNVSMEQFNKSTAYYFAATLNNAHYEVRDMCYMDGIVPQHSDMKYLLQPTDNSGSTVMLHKMGSTANVHQLWSMGLPIFLFANMAGMMPTAQYMAACPPDLVIGTYNGEHALAGSYQSDQIRLTMYHELGHAVHYRKAGNGFWQLLVGYEAQMSLQRGHSAPYGDTTEQGHEICALAEMWAEHIGYTYLHRRYGSAHSNGGNIVLGSWFTAIERIHISDGYIPYGLLHDLMDNNTQNTNLNANLKEDVPFLQTVDNVSGFTNKMLFDQLWSASGNITEYKNNLRSAELPNTVNTVAAYDALWAFYGY